jgi:hypothetical protein
MLMFFVGLLAGVFVGDVLTKRHYRGLLNRELSRFRFAEKQYKAYLESRLREMEREREFHEGSG